MATETGRPQSWLSLSLEMTSFHVGSPPPGYWYAEDPAGNKYSLNVNPFSWQMDYGGPTGNSNHLGSLSIGAVDPQYYGSWHLVMWVGATVDGQRGVATLKGYFMVGEPPVIGPKPPGCL